MLFGPVAIGSPPRGTRARAWRAATRQTRVASPDKSGQGSTEAGSRGGQWPALDGQDTGQGREWESTKKPVMSERGGAQRRRAARTNSEGTSIRCRPDKGATLLRPLGRVTLRLSERVGRHHKAQRRQRRRISALGEARTTDPSESKPQGGGRRRGNHSVHPAQTQLKHSAQTQTQANNTKHTHQHQRQRTGKR